MSETEKVAILTQAKDTHQRVTIQLTDGKVFKNLGVVEVLRPQLGNMLRGKETTTHLLPYIVRFSTDNPKLVAFGTSLAKIEEITVDVS